MTTTPPNNTQPRSIAKIEWCRNLFAIISLGPLLLFVATQFGQFSLVCELLSNFQLFVFFCLLPFPFVLYWFGMKRLSVFLGLAAAWSLFLVASVYLPANRPEAGPNPIRIMSFNVMAMNPNHASVLEIIEENDPDILLVVEYSRNWVGPLSILQEKYPHRVEAPRGQAFDIALFSKLPISSQEIVQLTPAQPENPVLVANIEVSQQTLRIVGIHVTSPTTEERLQLRNNQFQNIGSYLADADDGTPTLLVGDFNCTIWSPYLKRLLKKSRLADSRQGFGYMASWNTNDWPFQIPIDHFFVSEHIHVHDRGVGAQSGGSDHFPIFCEVSISPQK